MAFVVDFGICGVVVNMKRTTVFVHLMVVLPVFNTRNSTGMSMNPFDSDLLKDLSKLHAIDKSFHEFSCICPRRTDTKKKSGRLYFWLSR